MKSITFEPKSVIITPAEAAAAAAAAMQWPKGGGC